MSRYTKICFIGVGVGLLLGYLGYFYQSVTWKAQGLVGLATYINQIQSDPRPQALALETASIVVERVNTSSFRLAAAKRVGEKRTRDLILQSVTIKPTRTRFEHELPAVVISVVGTSSESAAEAVHAVVSELNFKHNQLLNVYKRDVENKSQRLLKEINLISSNMNVLMKSNNSSGVNGLALVAIQDALLQKESELSKLDELISKVNLRETELLEPVFVNEQRTFKSLFQAIAIGAIVGLCMSIIVIRLTSSRGK